MLDSNYVKSKLTTEDIIKLCCYLQGSEEYYFDSQNHPIFNTCLDHSDGESWKLYYYSETGLFHCYTNGGSSYDVFELVCRAKNCEFREAFQEIINFFHIKDEGFEEEKQPELIDDWDIFQKMKDYKVPEDTSEKINIIQENLLEYFYPLAAPIEWQKDGISPEIMYYYGIRIDPGLHKIIIPHRDIEGHLIGIRGRSFDPIEINAGKKYMPVIIQGDIYRHPLGKNLFGLYENKETIKNIKKVLVVESEKSVMQLASMYGVDNCWAVATCGSSFSKEQMDLLLKLGVEEVILGYDREFQGGKGAPDTKEYESKLYKIISPLLPYVNVSVIMDYDGLTNVKDSPTDKGRRVFEELYHQRIKIHTPNEKITSKKKRVY